MTHEVCITFGLNPVFEINFPPLNYLKSFPFRECKVDLPLNSIIPAISFPYRSKTVSVFFLDNQCYRLC